MLFFSDGFIHKPFKNCFNLWGIQHSSMVHTAVSLPKPFFALVNHYSGKSCIRRKQKFLPVTQPEWQGYFWLLLFLNLTYFQWSLLACQYISFQAVRSNNPKLVFLTSNLTKIPPDLLVLQGEENLIILLYFITLDQCCGLLNNRTYNRRNTGKE